MTQPPQRRPLKRPLKRLPAPDGEAPSELAVETAPGGRPRSRHEVRLRGLENHGAARCWLPARLLGFYLTYAAR